MGVVGGQTTAPVTRPTHAPSMRNTTETSNKQWLQLREKTGTEHGQTPLISECFKKFTGNGYIVLNEVLIESLKEIVRKCECIECIFSIFKKFNYKRICIESGSWTGHPE